jgi:hypothetical protein
MELQMEQKPIRQVMLEVVAALSKNGHNLQTKSTLTAVAQQVGGTLDAATQQAILEAWYDLFSSGHLCWGLNLSNAEPPFCHLTDKGKKALEHLSCTF